jgi:toxin ParE1/3/4
MRLFHLTKRAVSDLADIWEYTSEHWSEKQAEKYYMLLFNSCQEIAKEPRLGKCY